VNGSIRRPTQPFPVRPRIRQTSPGSFPKNFPFELRENRQQPGHRSTGWRRQIQRLCQRDEADAEVFEFLECGQ